VSAEQNRKILVIDDNRAIHDDFRKILADPWASLQLAEMESALFGTEPETPCDHYAVDSAYQGSDGLEMVKRAAEAGAPYALVFVDIRMPPGWDGVQTSEKIWEADRDVQIVICTAYSDYPWNHLQKKLGATDRLLILKKPFDMVEVRQLACALTTKWQMARRSESLHLALMRDIAAREEVQRRKDELVATVSHELRTPLTSIRGALGLLEGGVVGSQSVEALEIIRVARTNAERMIRLINDILDLEKLEAGKLQLKMDRVEIPKLVTSTLDSIRTLAVEAGVELRTGVIVPGSILGDSDRLIQVLTNLISNAIRFSSRNGTVHVHVDSILKGWVRFSVTDQGVGIAPEHVPKLFDRFQQADRSDARCKGGTGLGLSISKAIVQQHGGEIGLESRVGHGSTFWFELPAFVPSGAERHP
jgi:two-component system, sensor histidine kinase and response regulator